MRLMKNEGDQLFWSETFHDWRNIEFIFFARFKLIGKICLKNQIHQKPKRLIKYNVMQLINKCHMVSYIKKPIAVLLLVIY